MYDRAISITIIGSLTITLMSGCTGLTGTPHANEFVAAPGQYPPAPAGAARPHVGVPAMAVTVREGVDPKVATGQIAGDQLVALLVASGRLSPVDRTRVNQMLIEQGQSGAVEGGRLVRPASFHALDYLLLGEVRDLSVRPEPPPEQLSVAGVEQMLNVGPDWHPQVIVNCTVALRMVRPADGAVVLASQTPYHRAAPAKDLGLSVRTEGQTELRLSEADTTRVLRLALDAALRDMLPRLDRWTTSLPAAPGGAPAPVASASSTTLPAAVVSSTQPAVPLFCPECGVRVSKDDQFCPNCGAKLH